MPNSLVHIHSYFTVLWRTTHSKIIHAVLIKKTQSTKKLVIYQLPWCGSLVHDILSKYIAVLVYIEKRMFFLLHSLLISNHKKHIGQFAIKTNTFLYITILVPRIFPVKVLYFWIFIYHIYKFIVNVHLQCKSTMKK